MHGDDLAQVPDDPLGIKKAQGQFLFPAGQTHQHLERLAMQADFQGFFHGYLARRRGQPPYLISPDGKFGYWPDHFLLPG